MFISIVSYKGGVGKTTTAFHLSALLGGKQATALIDGDANRSAITWASRGNGDLPFSLFSEKQFAARRDNHFVHRVIDTAARPSEDELADLVAGCDKILVVSSPDALAMDALMPALETLEKLKAKNYCVLLTMIPPVGNIGEEAKQVIKQAGFPLLNNGIRRYAAFQKAALEGKTVNLVSDPHAITGWEDYVLVGKELFK